MGVRTKLRSRSFDGFFDKYGLKIGEFSVLKSLSQKPVALGVCFNVTDHPSDCMIQARRCQIFDFVT